MEIGAGSSAATEIAIEILASCPFKLLPFPNFEGLDTPTPG